MSRKISSRDGDEQHREWGLELCTSCGGSNYTPTVAFMVRCVRCGGNRIEPKLTMHESAAAMKSMMELAVIVRNQG